MCNKFEFEFALIAGKTKEYYTFVYLLNWFQIPKEYDNSSTALIDFYLIVKDFTLIF